MYTKTQRQRRSPLSTFFVHFSHFATEQVAGVSQRVKKTRDVRHLKELPDYLLHDVGIERDEIEPVVDQGINPGVR